MNLNNLRGQIRSLFQQRPWYKDLCDYYHVIPEQALVLGTRSHDRRPNLPGSATTHEVTGKTFDDLWNARDRNDPAGIHAFYSDVGAWFSFRQVVYHRNISFRYLMQGLKSGYRMCEYGAGVAPACFWVASNSPKGMPLQLTAVDVPCEHLTFGAWRLGRLIGERQVPITFEAREVLPDRLPLEGTYDLITILEVYEHLNNSLEVTTHLCEHLKSGGLLWENYILHDDPHAADLEVAQQERSRVFAYLFDRCRLVKGKSPDTLGGGGTRCWAKR